MATLTEVSKVARKGVVIGIGFVIFLMMYPILRASAIAIYRKYNPPPPPPPNARYSQLPILNFPPVQQQWPQVKLETVTGGFPRLPLTVKVYLVSQNKSRLSSLDNYRRKATAIGLSSDPVQIDDIRYRFLHPRIQANMVVNLITDQIEYKYDWTRDRNEIVPGKIGPPDGEIQKARSFFAQLGLTYDDLQKGEGKVTYYVATGSAFLPTNNYVEAMFSRVDLFRASLDNLPFVTAGGNFSPVNVVFSSTVKKELEIISANYYYSKLISATEFATYSMQGVEKAYTDLTNGKGYIVRNTLPVATIRQISLAYFEPNEPQDYIQPVYVFEGDAGFLAYVQAVDESRLVGAPTPTTEAK